LVLAAGAAILLSACTASNSGSSPHPAASSAARGSVTPTPTHTYAAAKLPPASGNVISKFHQVSGGSCHAVPGGWALTGSVKNPSTRATSYDVLVYFTTAEHTVLNSAQAKVTVKGGQQAGFTASQKFDGPAAMHCVIVSVK
jgi:hypothetical protein